MGHSIHTHCTHWVNSLHKQQSKLCGVIYKDNNVTASKDGVNIRIIRLFVNLGVSKNYARRKISRHLRYGESLQETRHSCLSLMSSFDPRPIDWILAF
jgi:hypothetical protein